MLPGATENRPPYAGPTLIGRTIGRFRVESKLGQGGMATVWMAGDTLKGGPVALKILKEELTQSPEDRRRFVHEARNAALLDHPGVAAVIDAGESGDLLYIAFSYVDGETVSDRVARSRLAPREAVRVVRDAALALAEVHARQVVHRDVTGRNIMIARDGRVVVLDFGLSLAAGQTRLTSRGTELGTAHYMAPEVIEGREAGPTADVYGLGVVLFEALTGAYPFPGDRREAVFHQALSEEPRRPRALRPEVGPLLETAVLRAISRDVAQRFASATELGEALEQVTRSGELDAPASAEPPAVRDGGRAGGEASTVAQRPMYLAVLGFADATLDGDAGGNRDGARSMLARDLATAVRTEAMKLPGVRLVGVDEEAIPPDATPRDLQAAARRIGANHLLRGTLRRAGMQVRVTYSVYDVDRGLEVGGDTVDGSGLDAFDLEDRVATSIVRVLGRGTVADEDRRRRHDPAARDHLQQALVLLKRHDNEACIDGALGLLGRLPAAEADSAVVQSALARGYLSKHTLTGHRVWEARAAQACQRALELDAEAPEARTAQGLLLATCGEHGRAIECFEHTLSHVPDDVEALLGLAASCAERDRHGEAETACRDAMRIDPDDWRPWARLGRLLCARGAFEDALPVLTRVIELRPDNPKGHMNLGGALYHLDRFEEAIASFRRSLGVQPTARAYSNLGTALFTLGRYAEALDPLERAARLSPLDPLVLGNLGIGYRYVPGHEADAARALEEAIALVRAKPEHADADPVQWSRAANWYAALARNGEAHEAIARALERAPTHPVCHADASRAYWKMGDKGKAVEHLRQAVGHGYGAEALRRDPDLQALRGDPDFERALKSEPREG